MPITMGAFMIGSLSVIGLPHWVDLSVSGIWPWEAGPGRGLGGGRSIDQFPFECFLSSTCCSDCFFQTE